MVRIVNIKGRRWFQRSYGNTYHTVYITITPVVDPDEENVKPEYYECPMQYGYDDSYLYTAINKLVENGHDAFRDDSEPAWRLFEKAKSEGYYVSYDVNDVNREKDL